MSIGGDPDGGEPLLAAISSEAAKRLADKPSRSSSSGRFPGLPRVEEEEEEEAEEGLMLGPWPGPSLKRSGERSLCGECLPTDTLMEEVVLEAGECSMVPPCRCSGVAGDTTPEAAAAAEELAEEPAEEPEESGAGAGAAVGRESEKFG